MRAKVLSFILSYTEHKCGFCHCRFSVRFLLQKRILLYFFILLSQTWHANLNPVMGDAGGFTGQDIPQQPPDLT